jgi:outer membrane protein OmpA-like peptidoglycan-associated protein
MNQSGFEVAQSHPASPDALLGQLELQELSGAAQGQACPPLSLTSVSRFPRYQQSIQSLPLVERAQIKLAAHRIKASFRPGCHAVQTVRLVGHADRDVQRGSAFETKISAERAVRVKHALMSEIGNLSLVRRINWQTVAAGAAQMIVPFPRTELDRARNRRVEIALGTTRWCSIPATGSAEFNVWLQKSLNRVLGLRLPVTGRFDPGTRAALASFQTRNRLTSSIQVAPAVKSALADVARIPVPCNVVPVETVCGPLNCPVGQLSGKQTITLKGGPVVFEFCWSTLGFNPTFRGEVDPLGQPVRMLRFSCRRDKVTACAGGSVLRRHPAWKYQGAVSASGAGFGRPTDWHFSFLQTVRSSRWLAIYSGGSALECVVNNARDATGATRYSTVVLCRSGAGNVQWALRGDRGFAGNQLPRQNIRRTPLRKCERSASKQNSIFGWASKEKRIRRPARSYSHISKSR